jgi:hypothetical protein
MRWKWHTSCTKHAPISSQTLRRGLLGHVELRVSKKLCKGAGLPIIYEAAEAPEIIVSRAGASCDHVIASLAAQIQDICLVYAPPPLFLELATKIGCCLIGRYQAFEKRI